MASGGISFGANEIEVCLPAGDYTNDLYGDGICCSYGTGSYSLAGGEELASGGEFEFSESTAISLAAGGGAACEQVAASRTGEVTWASSDNCDAEVEVSYTYSDVAVADCSSGDSADEGGYTITRTFTVTSVDNCGNETVMSCDQIIIVHGHRGSGHVRRCGRALPGVHRLCRHG